MDIGQKVFSSLRWLAAGRFAAQIYNWAVTLFVIRLLDPSDYGIMAMAKAFTGFAELLREFGLEAALVQRKELDDRLAEAAFGMLLAVNVVIFIVLAAASPIAAWFFEEPLLVQVIPLLALQFPLFAMVVLPNTILMRRMDFKKKAIVGFAVLVTGSTTTLVLAMNGFGVWALVWGNIAAASMHVVGTHLAVRCVRRPRWAPAEVKCVIGFGSYVVGTKLLWYFYSQADIIIIGRLLGNEVLGIYSVAKELAMLPMQKLASILNEVGFAAFSRIQDDAVKLASHYRKATHLLAIYAFPVFWGISAVTDPLVRLFLGEKWLEVILPMQIMALVVPLRMLNNITQPALLGMGRPDVGFSNVLIGTVLLPGAFLVGVSWGLVGVSFAWLVAFPVLFFIMQIRAFRVLGVDMGQYLLELRAPALAGGLMLAVVFAEAAVLAPLALPPWGGLAILSTSGASVFIAILYLLDPAAVHRVIAMARR